MKLSIKSKTLKSLSADMQVLPQALTPQIAGGAMSDNCEQTLVDCNSDRFCNNSRFEDCSGPYFSLDGTCTSNVGCTMTRTRTCKP